MKFRLRLWLQLLLRLLLQITVVLIKMKFVLIEKNFIVVTARSEKNPGIYSKCTVHCVHCHWDFNKCFNPSQTLFWKKLDCRSRPELGFWVEPEPEPLFLQEPKVILTLIVFKFFFRLKKYHTNLQSNRFNK